MDQSVPPPAKPPVSPASQSPRMPEPTVGSFPRRSAGTPSRLRVLLRPRVIAGIAVLFAALLYGGRELHLRLTHVYEYDARVTADIVTVSSRADGWVTDLAVREGMRVDAGQVLVRIDDRVAKLRVGALQAQIMSLQAERARQRAEWRLNESQSDAVTRTRASAIVVREKALAALRSDLDLARLELARNRVLYERRVVNERQMQVAQAAVVKLESQIQQFEAEHEQATGSLDEARADHQKLSVIEALIAGIGHQETNLEAQLSQQLVDVEDRTIRSPVRAVIDRTFVLPGEYVASGQRILLLHNPDEVWVEANIKETQVGKLKLGQEVHVSVDAFPAEKFVGRVARIGSATTARFALLPTPNPSGNFTKITQRVPVKIDMVSMPKPLTPGMMVEVEIDIR